jgi:hypothetical protein
MLDLADEITIGYISTSGLLEERMNLDPKKK